MIDIEKIKIQMRKGILEYCILKLINNQGKLYASDIIKQLSESNLLVVEGTLYPLLSRLKNDQLLSYMWQESKNGPPRKYYSISPLGKQILDDLEKSWEELNNAIEKIQNK